MNPISVSCYEGEGRYADSVVEFDSRLSWNMSQTQFGFSCVFVRNKKQATVNRGRVRYPSVLGDVRDGVVSHALRLCVVGETHGSPAGIHTRECCVEEEASRFAGQSMANSKVRATPLSVSQS